MENPMAGHSQNVTTLFADICKSSKIYEVLGDQKAQQEIGRILSRLTDITEQYDGKVIKSIGDAVMSIFFSVENAVGASKLMQETVKQQFSKVTDSFPINIHIGFHHGPVIIDEGDIFGDAVNIASRVADYAKPRQIITTKTTIESLPESMVPLIRYVSEISVKNISEEVIVYEILWDKREITTIMDHQKFSHKFHTRLDLTIGNQTIVIDKKRPSVTIGRMDYNDIVIDHSWISRSHISIEFRKGIFMIADKSSNGTFIYPAAEEMNFIRKSEHPLSGQGIILLGMDRNNEIQNEVITYSVK
jgi:class 3 adenylate cyclase